MLGWRKRFLNSQAWKHMRQLVLNRDKYICAECGLLVTDIPEVHHTVELTEENYADPSISLNPKLLITLHHACHDRVHERFGHITKSTIVNDDLEIDYKMR